MTLVQVWDDISICQLQPIRDQIVVMDEAEERAEQEPRKNTAHSTR